MGLPLSDTTTSSKASVPDPELSNSSSSTRFSGVQATGAGLNTGAGVTRPKTEAELEADRLYEEAMEDEYAKREGGS